MLGAPRLHYTLATGTIASKEAAGHYALTVFEPRWHPLIEDALAYYGGAPTPPPYRRDPARRIRDAAAFVSRVIEAGNAIPARQPRTTVRALDSGEKSDITQIPLSCRVPEEEP